MGYFEPFYGLYFDPTSFMDASSFLINLQHQFLLFYITVSFSEDGCTICQLCETQGHSARDCSHAKIWFNLKETLITNATNSANAAPVVTFPPNEFVTH